MNKNRLLTALAALATAGGVAVAAAPAAGAATPVPGAAVTRTAPVTGAAAYTRETIDLLPIACSSPGSKWRVAQSGINIRATPGGPIVHSISKNATFLSRGLSNQVGVTCVANSSGTYWYYGVGQANGVHGWVGANWLALVANGPQY